MRADGLDEVGNVIECKRRWERRKKEAGLRRRNVGVVRIHVPQRKEPQTALVDQGGKGGCEFLVMCCACVRVCVCVCVCVCVVCVSTN